jgi:hypothetical protein
MLTLICGTAAGGETLRLPPLFSHHSPVALFHHRRTGGNRRRHVDQQGWLTVCRRHLHPARHHAVDWLPMSGPWVLGVLLGLKLLFIGIVMLTGGSTVKSLMRT